MKLGFSTKIIIISTLLFSIGIFYYYQIVINKEKNNEENLNDIKQETYQLQDAWEDNDTKDINLEDYQEITLLENNIQKIQNSEVWQYKPKVEITFLWDVMIWSRVWDAMDKHGQDYVYSWLRDYLSQKDAVVLNLETTVTDTEDKINKTYTFKAKKQHLDWLKTFNKILVANLANNHIWDYKEAWILDTMENLESYDIEYFWAWKNKKQADSIKIIEVQWVKLWLIGQTCISPVSYWATENKPWNSRFDKEIILQEIQKAQDKNVDIIVYNMHCGTEYTNGPNFKQIDYARFAIDSWANLVIWHHPHWYQPVEIYKDSFIFYSLWDTIFDIFRGRRTQEGIMANIIIEDKKITAAEIIPTYTQSYWNTIISNQARRNFALNQLYNISKKIWNIEWIKKWYIELKKEKNSMLP